MSAQNEETISDSSHPPYSASVEVSPMVEASIRKVSSKPDGEQQVLVVPNIDSAAHPSPSVGRASSISRASANKTFAEKVAFQSNTLVDDKMSAHNTTEIESSSDDAPSNKETTDDTLANSGSTQEVLISDTPTNEAATDETLVYDEHMLDRTLPDEPLLNEETPTVTISSNALPATVSINDVTLQSVTTSKESSARKVQRRRYTEVELYILQKMLFESYGIGKPLRGKERETFRQRLEMNPQQLSSWIYYHRRKEHQQLEIFARLYEKKRIQSYEDYLEIHHRCLRMYADTMMTLESTTSLVALYIAMYRH